MKLQLQDSVTPGVQMDRLVSRPRRKPRRPRRRPQHLDLENVDEIGHLNPRPLPLDEVASRYLPVLLTLERRSDKKFGG